MIGEQYHHKKRGGTYTVLGRAISKIAFKDDELVMLVISKHTMELRRTVVVQPPLFLMTVRVQRSAKVALPCSWVLYQSHHDHSVWARPTAEFLDGRFKRITDG